MFSVVDDYKSKPWILPPYIRCNQGSNKLRVSANVQKLWTHDAADHTPSTTCNSVIEYFCLGKPHVLKLCVRSYPANTRENYVPRGFLGSVASYIGKKLRDSMVLCSDQWFLGRGTYTYLRNCVVH